jgi:hypothetical protein
MPSIKAVGHRSGSPRIRPSEVPPCIDRLDDLAPVACGAVTRIRPDVEPGVQESLDQEVDVTPFDPRVVRSVRDVDLDGDLREAETPRAGTRRSLPCKQTWRRPCWTCTIDCPPSSLVGRVGRRSGGPVVKVGSGAASGSRLRERLCEAIVGKQEKERLGAFAVTRAVRPGTRRRARSSLAGASGRTASDPKTP